MSGNTFGATYYSDGKRIAPMLPDFPALSPCGRCEELFWVNEVPKIKNPELQSDFQGSFLPLRFPSLSQLIQALGKPNLYPNPSKEHYIRMYILWGFHDRELKRDSGSYVPVATAPSAEALSKRAYEENLDRLMEMLSEESTPNPYLIAEIHRYRAEFEKALATLEQIEEQSFAHQQMVAACNEKNRSVFQIDPDSQPPESIYIS
jgi:hypothetical protein